MDSVAGLHFTFDGGTIEAVVARGEDNLFTVEMCNELSRCLRDPPAGAHILRLRAEGPAFCLGRERAAVGPTDLREESAALIGLNRAIVGSALLTVAEVQGDAAGYGVGLASLCDISIAAPSTRFWFPEVKMNLAPSIVLAWLGPTVGRKQAFLLTATGNAIDARRAAEIGLVTEVSPNDQSLPATVAKRIETLRGYAPAVHAEIKRFLALTADAVDDRAYELAAEKLTNAGLARQFGRSNPPDSDGPAEFFP